MYNTETIEMRPSCFIRRKHGTEIIAVETIYIQTTKTQQVEFIYLYKLLYTDICNNNSQKEIINLRGEAQKILEGGDLGGDGERKVM